MAHSRRSAAAGFRSTYRRIADVRAGMSRFERKADGVLKGAEGRFMTPNGHSRAKEFAPVRSAGAPRMPNSKSAYGRLFLTRFGCRERRRQLRVFIATPTGEAIIEVNPR